MEICVFGFIRREHEQFFLENGLPDANSGTRPFVYVLLYRPVDEERTAYRLEYKPTVIHHYSSLGCVAMAGLQWRVREGDLLGAFIPENCSNATELIAQENIAIPNEKEFRDFKLLCPSQINLVIDDHDSECAYALYLNSSLGSTLDQIHSIELGQLANVSTRLNMRVVIDEEGMW